jgi:hypothetical protein
MSSRMSNAARWPTALLAVFCASASPAQEGATPPAAAPPPAAESPAAPPPAQPPAGTRTPSTGAARDEGTETPPAAAEPPEVNDEEFIPTEELQPDAAVTFPVDI